MRQKQFFRVFLKVLRTYSVEEKVISIIVAGVIIFLFAQSVLDLFHWRSKSDIESGNVYSEGLISDRPLILNPLYVDFHEPSRDVARLIFAGLVKYDPIKKALIDDLALLSISQDRKTYRFTLKDKVKWHDDRPLTIDDVYFTFHDLIQNPKFQNPVLRLNFEGVEIKLVKANAIEFKLQKPNSFFITNMNVGILPKHLLASVPIEQLPVAPFNFKPIGSGPYKMDTLVESFEDGRQQILLKSFDDFYGPKPKIRQIRFTAYPDMETLSKQLSTVNVIAKLPNSDVSAIQKLNRFTFLPYELPQYTAVFFNTQKTHLKKNKVRLALLKAIEKEKLLPLLKDKLAVDTPLLELNQSEWIYRANLQEANGALFDSGYRLGKPDNPYRKNAKGEILQFTLMARIDNENISQGDETRKVADFLIKSWQQVGVKVELQTVDPKTFQERLQKREYDMVIAGQSLGYNLDTYSYWHSSQADGRGLNLSNYKSFFADQLLEQIRDTFDSTEKNKKLKDLAVAIAKDVPAVFLYRPRYTFVTDGKINGIGLQNMAYASDRFAHVAEWN